MTTKTSLGLLLLSALTLTACSNRLDTANTEAMIKADIERQGRRLSLREVRCPTDVTRQAGGFFRCVGELNPEGTFTINVTQQDAQGNVTWDVPNSKVLLNLVKVEESLQTGLAQALGRRALIDCGSVTYRANQPGDRFECQVVGGITDGSSVINSVLVRIDASGNLDWQEMRTSNTLAAAPAGASNPGAGVIQASPQTGQPANSATSPATGQASGAAVSTTTTGPTGRPINRPYVPGDDD
ncbi:MAG: hypothetical protein HC929_18880 [Leptolyngbyaceae cyanobacterium SM2_5_2]|nr:hypothetical protein [Leptolyngbyaceae cyanobacterium SM2_5_2]